MNANEYQPTRILIHPGIANGNTQRCIRLLTGLLHDILGQGPFDEAGDINVIRASIVGITRSGRIEFRTNSIIRGIFDILVQDPPPAYQDLASYSGSMVHLVDPRSPRISHELLSSVICRFWTPSHPLPRGSGEIERTSRGTSSRHSRAAADNHLPGIRSYLVQRGDILEGHQSFRVSLDIEPPHSLRIERVRALRRSIQQPNCVVFKLTFE